MAKKTKFTVFKVTSVDVVGAIDMAVECSDFRPDPVEFEKLIRGPKFAELQNRLADALSDTWHDIVMDIVSEYVHDNLEVPA